MINKVLVSVHELNKITEGRCRNVNVCDARRGMEEFYKAIKLYGFENIKTVHFDEAMFPYMREGQNISEDVRALSAYGMMNLLQMSDSAVSKARLQKHYGDVSIETVLESSIGTSLCLTKEPLVYAMEKYAGKEIDKASYDSIYIQQLFNFVEHKSISVDLLALWMQVENLFKGVVTLGIDNVKAWYYSNGSQPNQLYGRELSEQLRAFCGLMVMHMYGIRRDSIHIQNIQDMLGLNSSISDVLGADYLDECKSLQEMVNKYFGRSASTIKSELLFLQKLFELIEFKKFDIDNTHYVEGLWTEIESLYKNVKMVGLENTKVCYWNEKEKKKVVLSGKEIPENVRAFCEKCVIYMYRMCDDFKKRSRLEEELGLKCSYRYILGNANDSYCEGEIPCISLREIAKGYLEN